MPGDFPTTITATAATHRGRRHGRRLLAVVFALVAGCVPALAGLGCGASSAVSEARLGKLRVEVARLELPRNGSETALQRDREYRRLLDEADAIEQFRLAAEIATFWGRYYEAANDYDRAIENYRLALRYDKREHYRLRSATNPLPNSSAIAISLANISVALEKKGDIEGATQYAERAFRINRALDLAHRVQIDALRLAKLHEKLGNADAAQAFRQIGQEVGLAAAASRHARGERSNEGTELPADPRRITGNSTFPMPPADDTAPESGATGGSDSGN